MAPGEQKDGLPRFRRISSWFSGGWFRLAEKNQGIAFRTMRQSHSE